MWLNDLVSVGPGSDPLGACGRPQSRGVYKMFHGTSVASARLIIANGFQPSSSGLLGKGVYVSRDKTKASAYPRNAPSSDRVVFELSVRVGRVKRIDKDNHPLQLTWSSNGYDTAWIPPKCGMLCIPSGLEEDCVFDPKRLLILSTFKSYQIQIFKVCWSPPCIFLCQIELIKSIF
uniref:Grass carp reovirus (GCRV)-induced gene 2p n=1 Tax=Oryzias melastigma TaxID=30732 RepID=A0A3B3D6Y2_ORYME